MEISKIIDILAYIHTHTRHTSFLTYTEQCGGSISALVTMNGTGGLYGGGSIQSPRHPSNYPAHLNCYWKIRAPDGYALKVKFRVLDIEPASHTSRRCDYDYLSITNLNSNGSILRFVIIITTSQI